MKKVFELKVSEAIAKNEVCPNCENGFVVGTVCEKRFQSYELRNRYYHKTCPIVSLATQEENLAQSVVNQGVQMPPMEGD